MLYKFLNAAQPIIIVIIVIYHSSMLAMLQMPTNMLPKDNMTLGRTGMRYVVRSGKATSTGVVEYVTFN